MTVLSLYLVCCAFVTLLLAVAAVLEHTELGRRFTERAIRWITR